jgi:hypothetical protein
VNDSPYINEPIADDDPVTGFRCACRCSMTSLPSTLPNDRRGLGKTFVLRAESGEPAILGFYTLSMAAIEVADLPDKLRRGLPQYPVPTAITTRVVSPA